MDIFACNYCQATMPGDKYLAHFDKHHMPPKCACRVKSPDNFSLWHRVKTGKKAVPIRTPQSYVYEPDPRDLKENSRRKLVPGYTRYMVTDKGDVVCRCTGKPRNRHAGTSNQNLKVSLKSDADGLHQALVVARLVGAAFCPDYSEHRYPQYIDRDPENCRATNLRWVSRAEVTVGPGGKNKVSKLTADDIRAIRKDNRSQRVLGEQYGISARQISRIQRGDVWILTESLKTVTSFE